MPYGGNTSKKHSKQQLGSMIFTKRTWKDRAAYHACSGASADKTEDTKVNLWDIRVEVPSERHQNSKGKSRDFPCP